MSAAVSKCRFFAEAAAAYVTYAHWLIRRLSGDADGPAILAL